MGIELPDKGKEHKGMPLSQLQIHHMPHTPLSLHPINLYIELYLSFRESMLLLLTSMRTVLEWILLLGFLRNHLVVMAVVL